MGLVGPSLGLYVGNLWSCGACWTELGARYVGSLQVACGLALLGPAWGCMLAIWGLLVPACYRSCGACW